MRKLTAKPNKLYNHGTDTKPDNTIPKTFEEAKKKNVELRDAYEAARAELTNLHGSITGFQNTGTNIDKANKYRALQEKHDAAYETFIEYNKEYRRIFREEINQEFRKPLEEQKSKNTITCMAHTKEWPFRKEVKMHILAGKKPKDKEVFKLPLKNYDASANVVETYVLGTKQYVINAPFDLEGERTQFPTLRGAKGHLTRLVKRLD